MAAPADPGHWLVGYESIRLACAAPDRPGHQGSPVPWANVLPAWDTFATIRSSPQALPTWMAPGSTEWEVGDV